MADLGRGVRRRLSVDPPPPEPDARPLHLYDLLPPDVLRRLDWVTLQCAAITKILPGNRCDSDLVLRFAATYREPGLRRVLDDMRRHPPGRVG